MGRPPPTAKGIADQVDGEEPEANS
jgi:hypothetical protein